MYCGTPSAAMSSVSVAWGLRMYVLAGYGNPQSWTTVAIRNSLYIKALQTIGGCVAITLRWEERGYCSGVDTTF